MKDQLGAGDSLITGCERPDFQNEANSGPSRESSMSEGHEGGKSLASLRS